MIEAAGALTDDDMDEFWVNEVPFIKNSVIVGTLTCVLRAGNFLVGLAVYCASRFFVSPSQESRTSVKTFYSIVFVMK